ncbi:23.7 kDa Zinc finger C2H2 type domain [Spodoptera frugiperda ascovirus 1a]|uniref:23.7 kDa Zinc finger C2H2 type domain n=1 Tax=Spodoptera frugiperda ascovirus 1a TaxID=113370 RepID=Q0E596_SFAVA|nr:23.7 kDa Zinc finger C2H2 type domain [Spodoptera frugiperda ascovirus 1a]CAL44605.1 23.7 kDa Zinc finger C2H2 type domain [Spodoptera frugiperda ascovirus 1a]
MTQERISENLYRLLRDLRYGTVGNFESYTDACDGMIAVVLMDDEEWTLCDMCIQWLQRTGKNVETRLHICNIINSLLEDVARLCHDHLETNESSRCLVDDTIEVFKFQTVILHRILDTDDTSTLPRFFADVYASFACLDSCERMYECQPYSAVHTKHSAHSTTTNRAEMIETFTKHRNYFMTIDTLMEYNVFEYLPSIIWAH